MWFIQTAIETLTLPTDSAGRTTLAGTASAWQHLVRDSSFGTDERALVCGTPLKWSIWAWEQIGRRVQLHDAVAAHEELAAMVRAEPLRACVLARFPKPGKRQVDNMLEVIIVVPPEQFARYEALVKFAMTLPAGHVAMTIPTPVVRSRDAGAADVEAVDSQASQFAVLDLNRTASADAQETQQLIAPGSQALMEGLEIVVARSVPAQMSASDLRGERRSAPPVQKPANLLHDDGDDWFLFRATDPAPSGDDSVDANSGSTSREDAAVQ